MCRGLSIRIRCVLSLSLLVLLHAVTARAAGDGLTVFASIEPLAGFVETVGDRHVDVETLVGAGDSPATYDPTPKQMVRLSRADALFLIGVPFEDAFRERIAPLRASLEVVDVSRGIEKRAMDDGADADEHGDHGHGTGRPDPHVWMNPRLVARMAGTIAETLAALDPEHADTFRANRERFVRNLEALDARLAAALAPLKGKEFFVYHPAFGYFGDAYGLKQVAVEAGGNGPGARRLAALIDRAKKADVKVIFVQPQFAGSSVRAIAESIGGAVVPLDPLARDYRNNMESMAAALQAALGGE